MEFLTAEPIQIEQLIQRVSSPERGGVTAFLGLVRNHHDGRDVKELGYSAYGPMAAVVVTEIVQEAERKWPVRVALQHRTGELAIGDIAVAIAVAGVHREEAFASCRYVIEELKRRVPIWKQELYSDGQVAWVDPTGGEAR